MINFAQWTLNTMQPEIPGIYNANNTAIQRYLDVFWNDAGGIIIAPINTPGNVKAASGQFVNVVVDNLTVKNQFTNLYDNNTTADFNFYKMYIDPAVQPRDPCTAATWWPQEHNGLKYLDVNKPYYKIQNITEPYVFNNNNLSQVVGIFLDPSLVSPTNQFQVLLDPVGNTYFTADASAAGDPSMGTGFYVELIAVSYDPSYGTTWAQYKYGLPVVGTGGGGSGSGTVGPGTVDTIAMFTGPNTVTNSPLTIVGSDLNTFAINADGVITLTNKKVTGVATPTDPSDAVNLDYANQFSTNASMGLALAQFIRSASIGTTLYWNAGTLDVSISLVGVSQFYVDGSLASRDASITFLFINKANNASLGIYATNASVGTALGAYATNASINGAGFAKNASLGLYATNASINTAGFATNASIGLAGFATGASLNSYATNASVNAAGFATNASIAAAGFLNASSLAPYATNVSIGLADFAKNSSLGIYTTNASVGLALGAYTTNTSINNTLAQFIKSTSTGFGLVWDASGLLDVSIAGLTNVATIPYVDGSLLTLTTYINSTFAPYSYVINNFVKNASFQDVINTYDFATNSSVNVALSDYLTITSAAATYITQTYVDGSLALQQLQIDSLDNRVTVLEASTGHVDFLYVDGSLAARDASITVLFNRIDIADASVLTLTLDISILDASLYALTVSSLNFATNASVNAAAFAKNSSVNYLYGWQLTQDATIALVIGANATQQSQITLLQNQNLTQDGSIIRMDSSINWLMSQTSGEITTAYFHDYVDGSLSARDSSISDLQFNSATYEYVDGSLAKRDVSILWLQNNSLTSTALNPYATNASVGLAIAPFATNASVGLVVSTINASLGLMATNSSVGLSIASFATNASVGLAIQNFATNSSVGTALNKYVPNASLGTEFVWNAGVLDVSIGAGVSSLSALSDVSISALADKSLIQYDIVSSKWKNVVPLDGSTYFQNKITKLTIPGHTTTGNAGDWSYDASYLFICTSTNLWGRLLLDVSF